MRVIVIGAGEVGFDVAKMLASEQHDVIVVDRDENAARVVRDKLDVMTIVGNGTSADVLEEAGIRKADMLVAVTTVDEVNIITCMLADRLGVGTTIARVRSDELTRTRSVLKTKDFGIDLVIHPEESAANEVVRLIRRASATDLLTFADGRIQLIGLRIDPDVPVIGKTLQQLAIEHSNIRFRIMGISRGMRTILPGGDETLQKNDQVFILARPKYISYVARMMGKADERMHHVMILGGTQVGAKIALQLGREKYKQVKLVEPNRSRAEQLAGDLSNVLIIHGDSTDVDLLVQEGLGEMDAFVAVTDDEESNLVTCLMAKHLGVSKTVALLSKGAYIPISQSIGLDAAVSKKLAVSREILRYMRGQHVLSVATVHGLDAEIIEIEAKARSPITRKSLQDLKLPKGVLVGAVIHRDRIDVATGETHIQPGDRAIVFAMPQMVHEIERQFASR